MPKWIGRKFTLHGETRTTREWADSVGMKYATLSERLRQGHTLEVALTTVVHTHGKPMRLNGQPAVPKKRWTPRKYRKWYPSGPVVDGKYWDGYKYVTEEAT